MAEKPHWREVAAEAERIHDKTGMDVSIEVSAKGCFVKIGRPAAGKMEDAYYAAAKAGKKLRDIKKRRGDGNPT